MATHRYPTCIKINYTDVIIDTLNVNSAISTYYRSAKRKLEAVFHPHHRR